MSQNPFDALGGGGFDMNALLEQAQQMQEQLTSAQQRLTEEIVEGTVAGGAVTVTLNGVGELAGVDIKAGEFDGSNPEDLEDLGAVIVAAYREAKQKADRLTAEAMGPLAGGGLPGMGGLPGQPGPSASGESDPDGGSTGGSTGGPAAPLGF